MQLTVGCFWRCELEHSDFDTNPFRIIMTLNIDIILFISMVLSEYLHPHLH